MSQRTKRQEHTSFDELHAASSHPFIAELSVGQEGQGAPRMMHSVFPPGYVVGPHTHATDYVEVILAGSQKVTRRWHHPGDIRIVRAGTVYGPLEAGPEGATVLIVFADSRTEIEPPIPGAEVWVEESPGERRLLTHGPKS